MPTKIQLTDPILDNIQANILKGHGRNFAHHLFFQFDKDQIEALKNWIRTFQCTSAKDQLIATEKFKAGYIIDGGTIFTLSLSSTGYNKLGLAGIKPAGASFDNGMQASSDLLGDDISIWDKELQESIDMMILVADDDSKKAKKQASQVITETTGFAKLLLDQRGNVLKMKGGSGIEHFGYADGISQPLYLEDDIANQTSTNQWDDETDTVRLLVNDTPSNPDSFGSFLVFRKLEQNIKAFKDAEGDNPPVPSKLPTVRDVSGNSNPELAGAMIVGRFENGTPTVQSSIELNPNPFSVTNDFDYRSDLSASKCPFHSHIRLMNPRNGDVLAGDVREQRITRRGMPYDDVQRIPEDRITTISDDLLDSNQPQGGVGLLFMCYQSNIETQFEIMQGFWANKGNIAGHIVDGQDSLIGQGTNPQKTLPTQWGQPVQSNPFSFHGFVKNKGGEYFFTPSIGFLRGLLTTTPMFRENSTKSLIENKIIPKFSNKALKFFLNASSDVEVTYKLEKTASLSLVENGFFIGGTLINLSDDQKDQNSFESSSPYSCTVVQNTISIELMAGGFSGDNWELEIFVDNKELNDSPITEFVDSNGRADHDGQHTL